MGKLIRILLVVTAYAAVIHAQSTQPWQVTLRDGTKAKVWLAATTGQIEVKDGGTMLFTIPTDSIQEVLYTRTRVSRSTKTWDYFEKRCCGGTNSHLLGALAAAIAAPTGSAKSHYVEIHWFVNVDHVVALELAKNEYRPFLNWLQQLSGVQWRDVEQERDQAMKRIEQSGNGAFLVEISYPGEDQDSFRFITVLPAHDADDSDETQLYIFSGAVKAKSIVGILPARRRWSINKCVDHAQALYGQCRGDACDLAAIVLPVVTYWIAMEPPDLTSHSSRPESDVSCTELAKQKAEREKHLHEQNVNRRPAQGERPPNP